MCKALLLVIEEPCPTKMLVPVPVLFAQNSMVNDWLFKIIPEETVTRSFDPSKFRADAEVTLAVTTKLYCGVAQSEL